MLSIRLEGRVSALSSDGRSSKGGAMAEALQQLVLAMVRALAAFDPSDLSGDACAAAVGLLSRLEKACAAARARAAARATECGAHRRHGFRDGDEWLSRQAG